MNTIPCIAAIVVLAGFDAYLFANYSTYTWLGWVGAALIGWMFLITFVAFMHDRDLLKK